MDDSNGAAEFFSVDTRDGRRIGCRSDGTGDVTAVFAAGLGKPHQVWHSVLPLVARYARTVAYDRPGYGESDRHAGPLDLDGMIEDFLDLIGQIEGPLVLVGHSYGGPLVRAVAAEHRERVRGVVLVDEVPEERGAGMGCIERAATMAVHGVGLPMAAVGRLPLFWKHTFFAGIPEDAWKDALASSATARTAATALREELRFASSLVKANSAVPDLHGVAATSISKQMPGKENAKLVAAQRRAIATATPWRHIVADTSSHYIQLTRPADVAREVLRLVDPSAVE